MKTYCHIFFSSLTWLHLLALIQYFPVKICKLSLHSYFKNWHRKKIIATFLTNVILTAFVIKSSGHLLRPPWLAIEGIMLFFLKFFLLFFVTMKIKFIVTFRDSSASETCSICWVSSVSAGISCSTINSDSCTYWVWKELRNLQV